MVDQRGARPKDRTVKAPAFVVEVLSPLQRQSILVIRPGSIWGFQVSWHTSSSRRTVALCEGCHHRPRGRRRGGKIDPRCGARHRLPLSEIYADSNSNDKDAPPRPFVNNRPTNTNDHESKARVHPASPLIVAVIDDGTLRLNIAIEDHMGSSKAVRKGPVRTLFYETLRWYKTRQ